MCSAHALHPCIFCSLTKIYMSCHCLSHSSILPPNSAWGMWWSSQLALRLYRPLHMGSCGGAHIFLRPAFHAADWICVTFSCWCVRSPPSTLGLFFRRWLVRISSSAAISCWVFGTGSMVFARISAMRRKFNSIFQEFFTRVDRIFILQGGLRIGVSFYGV